MKNTDCRIVNDTNKIVVTHLYIAVHLCSPTSNHWNTGEKRKNTNSNCLHITQKYNIKIHKRCNKYINTILYYLRVCLPVSLVTPYQKLKKAWNGLITEYQVEIHIENKTTTCTLCLPFLFIVEKKTKQQQRRRRWRQRQWHSPTTITTPRNRKWKAKTTEKLIRHELLLPGSLIGGFMPHHVFISKRYYCT